MTPYSLSRLTLAFAWAYHGLVPKLLGPHRDEMTMNLALGLSEQGARQLAYGAGIGELLMAAVLIACWRRRWPLMLSAAAMIGLLAYVLVLTPQLALGAFNPVTTNLALLSLSLIALSASRK